MALRIAWFGTYDPSYPRNRVLIDGLRAAGAEVTEFSAPLSSSLTAGRMASPVGAGTLALELTRAHLALLAQHRSDVAFDVLVVGYPGHLVVPFAAAVARARRALLVFDPLVSLYDTFVEDRQLLAESSLAGEAARLADGLAFSLPRVVLADTTAHADYYRAVLGVPERKLVVVPVGALTVPGATGAAREPAPGEPLTVLMYGKWSPLHGVETVLEAAGALSDTPLRFVLIGEGQLSRRLRELVSGAGLDNVRLVGALPPWELRDRVVHSDVCLGVFGTSGKASRVVPNKVYDALAAGRPVVTQDSPAARELLSDGIDALLVPAGDAAALAAALRRLLDGGERARLGLGALELYRRRCNPEAVAAALLAGLEARL